MSFLFGNTKNKSQLDNKAVAGLNTDEVNTNQEAVPVPYVAGRTKIALHWMTPAYRWSAKEVKAKTGKSSSTTVGHNYYADLAGLVCLGMVDRLFKVIFDGEVVWESADGLARGAGDYADFTVSGYGAARIYWGTETQPIDTLILLPSGLTPSDPNFDPRDISTWPNKGKGEMYDNHPAYRGQCYMVFKQLYFGSQDKTSVPNIEVEIARKPDYFSGTTASADHDGVSGSLVLYEALTDKRYGMSLDPLTLDRASFESMREYHESNGYRLSPNVTSATTFREFAAKTLEYYDGFLRVVSGKLQHGAFRRGAVDTGSLPAVSDAELTDEPVINSEGWQDTVNHVGVIYKEAQRLHKDDIQKYTDSANFTLTGELKQESLSRPWINNGAAARRYAVEYGKIHAVPKQSGSLKARREAVENLLPGELFKLNLARFGKTLVCRCTGRTDADAKGNTVSVEWESERGLWPTLYVPPPALGLGNFTVVPLPLEHQRIVELPSALKDTSAIGVAVLAERNDALFTGFRVWFSVSGGSYDAIAESNAFAVRGVLAAALTVSGATADVTLAGLDAELIDSLSASEQGNDTLLGFVDGELVSVGAVTPLGGGKYRLGILRGRLGSAAENHAADGELWLIRRDRIAPVYNENFAVAQTRHFKLQPLTASGEVELSDCPDLTHSFTGNGLGAVGGLALSTAINLQTDGTLQSRVFATWTAINSPDVAQYEVALRQGGGAWDYRNVSSSAVEWLAQPNVVCEARVRAISVYGEKFAWSETKSITSARKTTAPAAPTGLTITASLRSFRLEWTNPADKDLAGVEVWMDTQSSFATQARVGLIDGRSYDHLGIAPGTLRYFRVRAVDTSGNVSGYSAAVSATTPRAVSNDIDSYAVQTQNIASGAITSIMTASGTGQTVSGVINMSGGTLIIWGSLFLAAWETDGSVSLTARVSVNGSVVKTYLYSGTSSIQKDVPVCLVPGNYSGNVTVSVQHVQNSSGNTQNMTFVAIELKR